MSVGLFLTLFGAIAGPFRLVRLVQAIHSARRSGRGRLTARPLFWVMTGLYLVYAAAAGFEAAAGLADYNRVLGGMGVFLFVSALALRERAMRELGRFFSPDIEIRKSHEVVREGLYRYVRHPLLCCMGLEVLGLGLALNAWGSLALIGLGLYAPLIVLRQRIEEKALVESLGESYRRYQREVGAFWPRVYGG